MSDEPDAPPAHDAPAPPPANAHRGTPGIEGAPADPVFEALWERALEAWDDDGPHRGLLKHALEAQLLPELAGRYRALKDDPAKGPRAQRQIDRIVAAATQLMLATKTPARTKTPWQWTASAAFMFAVVVAWLAYLLLFRR